MLKVTMRRGVVVWERTGTGAVEKRRRAVAARGNFILAIVRDEGLLEMRGVFWGDERWGWWVC